jgi:hypothetical protein
MNAQKVRIKSLCIRELTRLGVISLMMMLGALPVRATTVIAPAFNQLVGQADYIVHAVVKSVSSEIRGSGLHRHIITKVEVDVREVISGVPPDPLILQMVGGKVGSEEMVVDGAPKFEVGDEDILFVHGNGRQINPLVALMHGRYPVKHDVHTGRDYISRSNGEPLLSEQQVSRTMAAESAKAETAPTVSAAVSSALSPAEFTNRIKMAIKQNSASKIEN